MMMRARTRLLNLLRGPLRNERVEKILLRATAGRPPRSLVCRVVPNYYQYPCGTLRIVDRYGFTMNLDISEGIQWYAYWGFQDPSHEALISLCQPGDTVLDIGANIGLTALRMSAVLGNGKVYAFEPDPQNYGRFQAHIRSAKVPNVEGFQCALGSEEGVGNLCNDEPRNRGCVWIDTVDAERTSSVRVTTVDRFCKRQGLSRVDLIKIDTEGAELAVLRGAGKVIEKWKPRLFVEVDDHNLRRAGCSSAALWGFLVDMGYSVRHAESGRALNSCSDLSGGHFDIICTAA